MFLDNDFNAGEQLCVELREDSITFVDPRSKNEGGEIECFVKLEPMTRDEAVLLAIALRKTYKRLEEMANALPDTRKGR